MTLENIVVKGLRREPAGTEEICRFLAKITTKLADAQKTLSASTADSTNSRNVMDYASNYHG